MAEGPREVAMRIVLRVERGRKGRIDDQETVLFDQGEERPLAWGHSPHPLKGTLELQRGHIHADVEHLLLANLIHVEGDRIHVTGEVRLEGHSFGRLGEALARHPGEGYRGKAARTLGHGLDLLVKQVHEVVDIYQDPVLRRQFARSLHDPAKLTTRMKRALLFLVLLSSIWIWLVGLTALALVVPALSVSWNVAFSLYFAALGTNLFLPIPMEPLVLASIGTVPATLAVLASGAGKAMGAWIIYTLGPGLRLAVEKLERRHRWMHRLMVEAEAFARRFGYIALGAMLAIPFSPFDIVPVYLFSTLGLRLGPFLAAVFVGFSLRLFLVVYLGQTLFGL